MAEQIEQDMHDITICNDLITSLITLKVILEDIDKINIVEDLEINKKIKELEGEKIDELEFLEEELRIRTLRNIFLVKPIRIEEEIELREQTRKKIDNIEEVKEKAKGWEFKNVKILEDLNYKMYDEIVEIAKIELKVFNCYLSKLFLLFLDLKHLCRNV